MRVFLVLLGALTLVDGCAKLRKGTVEQAPRTVLEVDNRGFSDMTVYVVNGAQRTRLGMATGLGKTVMTIPQTMMSGAGELQFLADPIGSSRTAVSDRIYVRPGDRVTLMIPPN